MWYHIKIKRRQFYILILVLAGFSMRAQEHYVLDSISYRTFDILGQEATGTVRRFVYEQGYELVETVNTGPGLSAGETFEKQWTSLDHDGRILQQIIYRRDTDTTDWNAYFKSESSYHSNGTLRSHEEYLMQDSSWIGQVKYQEELKGAFFEQTVYRYRDRSWLPESRWTVRHNARGKDEESCRSVWDLVKKEWQPLEKNAYTYLGDTVLCSHITYEWVDRWEPLEKVSFRYHTDSRLAEETRWVWSLKHFIPVSKTVSAYDSTTGVSTDTVFVWSSTLERWVAEQLLQETLHGSGLVEGEIVSDWDDELKMWKIYRQAVFFHDTHGRISQQQYFSFDENNEVSGVQDVYKYDAQGNCYLMLTLQLDSKTDDWKEVARTELLFDRRIISGSFRGWQSDMEAGSRSNQHALSKVKHYIMSDGVYRLVSLTEYHYSSL